jgi:hypothetical protein
MLGDFGVIDLDGQATETEILDPVITEFLAITLGTPAIVAEVVAVGRVKES